MSYIVVSILGAALLSFYWYGIGKAISLGEANKKPSEIPKSDLETSDKPDINPKSEVKPQELSVVSQEKPALPPWLELKQKKQSYEERQLALKNEREIRDEIHARNCLSTFKEAVDIFENRLRVAAKALQDDVEVKYVTLPGTIVGEFPDRVIEMKKHLAASFLIGIPKHPVPSYTLQLSARMRGRDGRGRELYTGDPNTTIIITSGEASGTTFSISLKVDGMDVPIISGNDTVSYTKANFAHASDLIIENQIQKKFTPPHSE